MPRPFVTAFLLALLLVGNPADAQTPLALWTADGMTLRMLASDGNEPSVRLARSTLERFLRDWYGLTLPVAAGDDTPGLYLLVGTPQNNPIIARLAREGLTLPAEDLGDEGYNLLTFQSRGSHYLIIHGTTPRAIKHGCQELLFYHVAARRDAGSIDVPLRVTRRPQVAYRGIYILPCWSAHDSLDSWRRVLRFTSELTLNRIWFWLDGFPVAGHRAVSHMAGRASDYDKTDLARDENVQSLMDLVNAEEMKFYIGGGWMSWHQRQAVGKDAARSQEYYGDYLRTFRGVGGFYFEPTGEGHEDTDWPKIADSLCDAAARFTREQPAFEIAVAIGKFNNRNYLKRMARLDPQRVFWWWCWGDPFKDDALSLYPAVLGWHTVVRMSNFHGTIDPPSPATSRLRGFATSYDPGMGFGNSWNGWGKLGVDKPRNFDPYTIPYFSHEYWFRERCWDPAMTRDRFRERLGRRLFDADMPPESIDLYLGLADACANPAATDPARLRDTGAFLQSVRNRGTLRNRDTLARMNEALEGLRAAKTASTRPK